MNEIEPQKRTPKRTPERWTLDAVDSFDDIIDVRSPSEFREDHIPGALNLPVLDDARRREVGVLYKRSKHEAKKLGAALVSANIATHLREALADKPSSWSPLVYCWRGGERSASLVHVLRRVGWKAARLDGGYKTYRRLVRDALDDAADALEFRVLCGRTGVGKSRLLEKLAKAGAQVIDLEKLANHRGSVLGEPIAGEQPPQKFFDSLLCRALRSMDAGREVYVEAESRRIGRVQLPAGMVRAMRAAPCVAIEADLEVRGEFLMREYRHFIEEPPLLKTALDRLIPFVGGATVEEWLAWCADGATGAFVRDVLEKHYDPIYLRSMRRNFSGFADARARRMESLSDAEFERVAAELARGE